MKRARSGSSLAAGARVIWLLVAALPVAAQTQPPGKQPASNSFDKTGPQVGHQVADLILRTLKGEPQRLADAWHSGPALLVTSSLTCPKSRSRWPELKALVEKYEGKLNVVVVYVIEAHPVGSVCPYKGVEDITPENERDGILRKQPASLEDRLELAQEFKRLLRINSPIYVDNLQNEAWKALGAAPNLALLVDEKGIVAARSGWFEGASSQVAINVFLAREEIAKQSRKRDSSARERDERSRESIDDLVEAAGFKSHHLNYLSREQDTTELARLLKAVPAAASAVIRSQQGHPHESTVLMDAVLNRNLAAFKLLLEAGADVHARTDDYDAALQIAAQLGEIEMVKSLLNKGADPAFPATGKSPLHEAALHQHPEIIQLLLATGQKLDFYTAIAMGEIDLLRQGLKADPSRAFRPDGANRYPLDYAAANGQLEIAKLLLEYGAPVVTEKHVAQPPALHRAIEQGHEQLVALLLAAGSSPNTAVGHGGEAPAWQPALHLAVDKKHLAIVKQLIAHRVDLEARDRISLTALHNAASDGEAKIVTALIEAGADVHAKQLRYPTPCGRSSWSDPSHATPLHFAASAANAATIEVLLKAGAKVDAHTSDGETPLMSAVESRGWREEESESRLAVVETLIAAGANVNATNSEGKSVLDLALQPAPGDDEPLPASRQALVDLLKHHGAKPGMPSEKPTRRPRRDE